MNINNLKLGDCFKQRKAKEKLEAHKNISNNLSRIGEVIVTNNKASLHTSNDRIKTK
ncbi:MAG TPA: hypothetical protein PLT65_03905 [Bacilli bacterium]|nr:hypothetical protein [Bacilli bacterium]